MRVEPFCRFEPVWCTKDLEAIHARACVELTERLRMRLGSVSFEDSAEAWQTPNPASL